MHMIRIAQVATKVRENSFITEYRMTHSGLFKSCKEWESCSSSSIATYLCLGPEQITLQTWNPGLWGMGSLVQVCHTY